MGTDLRLVGADIKTYGCCGLLGSLPVPSRLPRRRVCSSARGLWVEGWGGGGCTACRRMRRGCACVASLWLVGGGVAGRRRRRCAVAQLVVARAGSLRSRGREPSHLPHLQPLPAAALSAAPDSALPRPPCLPIPCPHSPAGCCCAASSVPTSPSLPPPPPTHPPTQTHTHTHHPLFWPFPRSPCWLPGEPRS